MNLLRIPLTLALLASLCSCAADKGAAFKCYSEGNGDGGSLDRFATQARPLADFSTQYPEETYKPNHDTKNPGVPGAPLRTEWIKLDPGMTMEKSLITTWHGHAIYTFTFKPNPNDPSSAFDTAVVAWQVNTGKDHPILRPFFILDGTQVSDFSASPSTHNKQPAIEFYRTLEGNGVFETTWIALITGDGPRFVESTDTGRKVPTVTTYFNAEGKAIKVVKENNEDQ